MLLSQCGATSFTGRPYSPRPAQVPSSSTSVMRWRSTRMVMWLRRAGSVQSTHSKLGRPIGTALISTSVSGHGPVLSLAHEVRSHSLWWYRGRVRHCSVRLNTGCLTAHALGPVWAHTMPVRKSGQIHRSTMLLARFSG